MTKNLMESVEDMCVDLDPEKTGDIRRHLRENLNLLKQENYNCATVVSPNGPA